MRTDCQTVDELRCGCVRGWRLCDTAVALWVEVNAAYRAACSTGDWVRYDEASAAYRRHIEGDEHDDRA